MKRKGDGGSDHRPTMPGYYNLQQNKDQPQQPGTGGNGVGGGGGGVQLSSEGYSYVTDVPSLPSHHRHSSSHHKSSSSSSHHHQGGGSGGGNSGNGGPGHQNRVRRTQRRVTHNEKRYHSGRIVICVNAK